MRRLSFLVAILISTSVVASCARRSELVEVRSLLEECRTDKVASQNATTSCEERYTKEVRRFEDLDAVVADVVPKALEEFRSEREEILELVPDAARQEVGAYLDELTDTFGRSFQVLRDANENIQLELEVAQTKLDALQARADSIGEKTASIGDQTTLINETLEGSLRDALEGQQRMRQQATDLIAAVQSFDLQHLRDRDSESRLKLNRHQRETIEQFHAELIGSLSALGGHRH